MNKLILLSMLLAGVTLYGADQSSFNMTMGSADVLANDGKRPAARFAWDAVTPAEQLEEVARQLQTIRIEAQEELTAIYSEHVLHGAIPLQQAVKDRLLALYRRKHPQDWLEIDTLVKDQAQSVAQAFIQEQQPGCKCVIL